ncbi:MAG: hypothetical protein KKB52_00535 [Candidatus Omnitrophica bacterium]|nr:hypothetical protein [Candidatus Omnitrophota bacterium]
MSAEPIFRRRRRQYIIKRGLQFRYIGIVFVLAILASLVTGYTVFATGWTLLGAKLANVYPQGRLLVVLKATNMALIRNLLLVSPFIFILGLFFSHKIAGPVYRIEKSLYEIIKGNLTLKFRLRKGDELWDLANLLTTMTESFNNSVSLNKDAIVKAQREMEIAKKLALTQPLDSDALQAAIKNLQANIEEIKVSLDKWTTEKSSKPS